MRQIVKQTGEWHPTPMQIGFLHEMQASGYMLTYAKISQKLNVDPRQWSRWKSNSPKFLAWWKQEADAYFSERLPEVYQALLEASKGAPIKGAADRRTFLERFDREFRPAQEIDNKLTIEQLVKSLASTATPTTETISIETAASPTQAKKLTVEYSTKPGLGAGETALSLAEPSVDTDGDVEAETDDAEAANTESSE